MESRPRKVLVLAMAFPPAAVGSGTYAHRLARGFAGKGLDVLVLAPAGDDPTASAFDRQQPYRVERLRLPGWVPACYWTARQCLRHALRSFRPDSLWTTNGMATRVAGLLPELDGRGLPVVSCMRGSDIVTRLPGRGPWARLESIPQRRCYRVSAAIAAASEYLKGVAVAKGVDGERIFVNPPAFGLAELEGYLYDPARLLGRYPFLRGRRIVLTVARLVEQKRVHVGISAFARVARRWPELCYVVVGEGPERQRLKRLAAAVGVADRVFLVGAVPPMSQHLYDLYSAAAIFVMLGVREGMGTVYLEAGAFGLASVAVDDGGAPEVIRHGETGLLAAPDNEEEVVTHLAQLAGDAGSARRMGDQARQWIRQAFSTEAMVERSYAVLCRVVRGGQS